VLDVAEKIPGPSTDALSEIAARNEVTISVGMPEKAGNRYHIAQVLAGPDGYIGKYRKHHPTGDEQTCGFSPGKTFPSFTIDGFRFGINICADGRQPGTVDALKKKRVDVIHHPHGNVLSLGRNSEEWTRGKVVYFVPRAVHARAYILINNSAGDTVDQGGKMRFGSGALAIDPLGQVVKRTTQETRSEKMIVVDLLRPLDRLVPDFEMRVLKRNP
jgi:predicted amidohydrolase